MPGTNSPLSSEAIANLLNGPAKQTPDGRLILHPSNRSEDQKWYYICVSLCAIVAGLFVILRLYTKIWITRKTDLSDYCTVLAYCMLIGFVAIGKQITLEGGGVHQWNVQVKHFMNLLYWMNINEIIYGPTIFLIKFAILRQYLSIFAPHGSINRFMHIGAWTLIGLNVVYYIIGTSLTIWACSPREKIWNPYLSGGHCLNYSAVIQTAASVNIFSDVLILLLPSHSVWQLRIPRRKKIVISLLFALGLLACSCSAASIYFVFKIFEKNADVTYNSLWLGLCFCGEITLGIIVTCTLTLPKFYEVKCKGIRNGFSKISTSWSSRTRTDHTFSEASRRRVNHISKGQTLSEVYLTDLNSDSESQKAVLRLSTT